jgi:O-succinylbenzoic acid--CoA ligase
VDVTAHRRASEGELVAYDLPAGAHWLDILEAHAGSGASFFPIDPRLGDREKRRLLDRARPTWLVTPDEEVTFAPPPALEPSRAWAVMATSGTSGDPRLADLPRAALGSAVATSLDALEVEATDPWVCVLGPAHVGGLLVLLRGVLGGAPVTVLDRFDPLRLVDVSPPGAHVALVPTMLHRLVEARMDLTAFGVLLVGGAALDPELRARAETAGGRVVSTYGLTETCGGIVYEGWPLPGTEVRIATDDRIEVRGPTLMDGYRDDPAATAAVFAVDGWLRTADIGERVGGRLRVLGRADDAIRTGALTVWPDEVESVLRGLAGVADVAVVGRPDEEWGQRVEAYVVPADPSSPPTLEALRERCRDRLANHEAPRAIHLVEELPRTAGGKLRRGSLR